LKAILPALRVLFYHLSKICQAFCRKKFLIAKVFDSFCYFLDKLLLKLPIIMCFCLYFFKNFHIFIDFHKNPIPIICQSFDIFFLNMI